MVVPHPPPILQNQMQALICSIFSASFWGAWVSVYVTVPLVPLFSQGSRQLLRSPNVGRTLAVSPFGGRRAAAGTVNCGPVAAEGGGEQVKLVQALDCGAACGGAARAL